MAAISSLGIGSGMDLNALVSQLVALERKPIEQLQMDASKLQSKVSLFGQMKSLMSALQDASNKLAGSTLWTQTKATSANTAAVTASSSNGALTGNYAVRVQSLAASQSVVGNTAYANSSELVGAGTITLELGTWATDLSSFTAKAGASSVVVTLDASDTLATMRDKINAADAGVTASLVTDASGTRLSIRSKTTGLENGFRMTVSDGDGNHTDASGLSRFGYDPLAGQTQLTRAQAAANASATINGISVSSASNELNGVIEGLNFKLLQVTATDVDVSVATDTDAISTAVTAFAKAYSDLAAFIKDQTKYDESSKAGSPLQGDSTATGLLNQLRSVINTASNASASFPRLSDIGLELQADGSLTVNSTKLTSALTNLTELKKAFATYDEADPTNNGFAKRYALLATNVLGTDGSLTTRTDSLKKMIDTNEDRQDALELRVDLFEQRLIAQYAAMDARVAQFNALSNYLSQQLKSLSAGWGTPES